MCEHESTLECGGIAGDYSSLGRAERVLIDRSYLRPLSLVQSQ